MRFGSLFSGVGGFDIGLERAGWTCAWQVEIDKFCNKVLQKRWPDVPRYGDIRSVGGNLGPVDLLVGGFPCQDLSIAGKRAGLAGERSGLFFEFARLASELRPRWLLVENVPGLLSSREGADFFLIIQALTELGYGLAWRTLDSRYFGVPQRRRRVFIVGHLGGPCPYEVLFEPEGGGGDLAASGAEGTELAGTLGGGAPGARGWRGDLDSSGAYIPETAATLKANSGRNHVEQDYIPELGYVRGNSSSPERGDMTLAHTLRASGFDASEDGTGRGTPMIVQESQTDVREYKDAGSLRANAPGTQPTRSLVMETLSPNPRNRSNSNDMASAVMLRMREGKDGGGKGPLMREDESLTLATANDQTLFAYRKSARVNADPDSPETWVDDGVANTLNGFDVGDVRTTHAIVAPAVSVRRLTPTECERLMSWPDGHTCTCGCDPYSTEACKCPDGPRYAAIGNGVVANVAEWVGRRIAENNGVLLSAA